MSPPAPAVAASTRDTDPHHAGQSAPLRQGPNGSAGIRARPRMIAQPRRVDRCASHSLSSLILTALMLARRPVGVRNMLPALLLLSRSLYLPSGLSPWTPSLLSSLLSCPRYCVEYLSTIRDVSRYRHPTGSPAAFPDGYGLRTRTDGPDRLRRPSRSHPPDFQGGPNAHEHGSYPPSFLDGYGGREPMRFDAITNV
jgi:hypothetical protein